MAYLAQDNQQWRLWPFNYRILKTKLTRLYSTEKTRSMFLHGEIHIPNLFFSLQRHHYRPITPSTRQCRATPHNITRVSRQHFQIIVFGVEKYLANVSHDKGICQIRLSAPRVPILRPSICQNAVKEIDPVLDSPDEVLTMEPSSFSPWDPSCHEIYFPLTGSIQTTRSRLTKREITPR